MQVKNSNPAAMERSDLASLFCMIGRHGPAVAVMAVVSVLAGLLLYRSVRGKRRRAEAEAGDGERDEPRLRPEPETLRGVEATGPSEEALPDTKNAPLRNRRAAAEPKPQHHCPPKMGFEPDEPHTSLVLSSVDVAGSCAEETHTNLKVDLIGAVDTYACHQDLINAVKEVCDEICASPEEVPESEGETVTDVSCEKIFQKEAPVCISNSPVFSKPNVQTSQREDGETPQAAMESYVEQQVVATDVPIAVKEAEVKMENLHSDAIEFSDYDCNCPSLEEEMKEGQPTALQHEPESLQHEDVTEDDQNADHSLVSEVMEKDVGEDPSKVDVTVLKPEEKVIADHEEEKMPSSGEEHGVLSEVLGPALECLNLSTEPQLEISGNRLCFPETVPSPFPDPAHLKENQHEKSDAVEIKSVGHLEFSFQRDPDVITYEKVTLTAPEKTTEVLPSLHEDKFDQMQNIEAPDMTEGIKPPICQIQPLTFDKSELTWSSYGVGEESGISSMTVSPDLQDPYECDMTPEKLALSVLHHCPQGEAQSRFFSDVVATNESDQSIVPAVSSSQQCQSKSPDESRTSIEDARDGAVGRSVVLVAAGDTLAGELKKAVDGKADLEGAEKEGDEIKTEISIMEATMDNNEWITDGNYHVNSWINLSVPSSAQNSQTDAEAEQNDTRSLPDKDSETSRKILAVQPMPQNVNVTFCTHYLTQSPYQKVAVTGNQQELGHWKGFVPLQSAKDGHWAAVVRLPAENHVEWKFVVVDKGEVCRWEECGNRLLDTGHGDDLHVHKWWGFH
ncbi:uncharacterized protein stbd1 [Cololabis saira]|uniref:uncharacterized protein stbd1 n=1 Tax=Cololabis saira TaxID=129043 RepID=UPI002AD39B30|nr:uncharacterized protein stbd1 [Cololabis saira]